MQKHCLTLDLKNDPNLIDEYKRLHQCVWPEITQSIKDAGISNLEIYNVGDRLFIIIEADSHFSFEKKISIRCCKFKSSGMGNVDVEISKSITRFKTGRKMDSNG